jgi:hypothetical protein
MEPAGDVTEAAPTAMAEPLAYQYEEWIPEEGSSRRGWVVAGSLVVMALAAVGAAVVVGIRTWTADVPQPAEAASVETREYRSPALLHPDQDTAFLQELDATGTIYDTAGAAIHNARMVCKMLAAGRAAEGIAADFARLMEIQDPGKSEAFVSIARQHYCPPGPVT